LTAVLERAQRLGFLGPGPVGVHLEHAQAFAAEVEAPGRALDLGSGGGVPGLVLAIGWPESGWVLLDANTRRAAFLEAAIADLGLVDRVAVVCERAERAARSPEWRSKFDLVVARSFGAPAVTAECAVGFLRLGGVLVVSEPPTDEDRWRAGPLMELGLLDRGRIGAVRKLEQMSAVPDRFPRRVGIPAKRPLW
jgi:16S rRNA (guanine527-N7)-methyltransferase